MDKLIKSKTRNQLADEYSNYDQCVEIVGCWHSWFDDVDDADFDHFPTIDIEGTKRTPDFLVSFNSGYALVGESCRLPMDDEWFAESVKQAVSYTHLSDETDVMLLVPHEIADQAEKRMIDSGLLDPGPDGEPLVVVSYVRTDATRVTQWVFKRASQMRSVSFRDAVLGDKSLHERMTVTLDGLRVFPKYFTPMKVRYPFCNDPSPALYTACVLWEKVFGSMLSDEDYLKAHLERLPHSTLRTTPKDVAGACEDQLDVHVRLDSIRGALDLLVESRLAQRVRGSKEEYEIKFGRVHVPGSENVDLHMLIIDRLFGKERAAAGDGAPSQQATLFTDS
jgi:hypothetical protein